MAIPLQKTKLFVPAARAQLVERPRLTARLDGLRAEGCRAALISAPAGSGKTTLVVQWLASQGIPVGWLSLDARDNAPPRFFAYLIAALQAVVPGEGGRARIGSEALALLDLPSANPEEIITLLSNDLAEARGPFILALDDFHTISNPLLHQAVDLLIEAQPPQMRLMLLSREDPGMQLARRRARGQLVELRQADLRFTQAEAVAFLQQTMGLRLTPTQVETLETRTEGWIAGLQMAALALLTLQEPAGPAGAPGAGSVERFLHDFSGSQRFILDYLMEEVLAHQPLAAQRFLLETAVLERMCAGLCAAVTGKTAAEAQAQLEQLVKANLFVIPLDEERHWYRYHHLFHDLLLARLQAEHPPRGAELEGRASAWYEANGEPRLAVEYALRAQDAQRAARLIEEHITERWKTVDLEFHLLLNRLPPEVLLERPALCLQKAWVSVIFSQTEQILPYVEAAEQGLAAGRAGSQDEAASRAFARTLRAYVADLANRPVALDDSLRLALAAIPAENVGMRNSMAVVIGTVYFMEGDFASALGFFEEALAADQQVNGTNAVPIATTRLALVLKAQGALGEALRRLRAAEAYVNERGSRRFYIAGAINLLIGDILLEWDRLDAAEDEIRKGRRLLEDWPVPQTGCLGLALLARIAIARGDLAAARAALAQADTLKKQHLHPIFADPLERARVLLMIAGHEADALTAWARETEGSLLPLLPEGPVPFRYEARLIELCRAWLALGQAGQAAELLERLDRSAQERGGGGGNRVTILALLAAARSQVDSPGAQAALADALRLAEGQGALRAFVDAGDALRGVLDAWLQNDSARADPRLLAHAQRVRATLAAADSAPPPAGLVERLSQREGEVLRLVAQGLTNQQIADRLVLSVRTVKKHVENIHGKLGVQNRTQAVARARELGLLA